MNKILKYLKPYTQKIVIGLLVKSSATIMELFLPWLLAYVIDSIIPTKQISLVFLYGFYMLISSILALYGNITANRLAAKISSDAIESLRNDSYEKIMSFSNRSADKFTIPSLISRMTSDTYHIYRMFNVIQRIGIRAPILLLGSIVMMLFIDTYLAFVLIALLPVILFVVILISKVSIPFYDRLQNSLDQLIRVVRENITGIRIIKALAKEDFEKDKFSQVNQNVSKREKTAGYIIALLNPLMNLILNMGLVVIVYIGAYRVIEGLSKSGSIIAFLSYFGLILNSFLAINRIFLLFSRANASANRINEILEQDDTLVLYKKTINKIEDHIQFNHVNFSYNQTKNDIDNISFKIKRHSTFGIIGSTGSGKSTIAQLLLRFYEIDSGEILIDGQDIRSFDVNELRRKFGVVFQQDVLFSLSVKENIQFGRIMDLDDVIDAVDLAQAKNFIEQLSDKYEEKVLRQGANFSGGQKQRMLIARALANNPEIIILDDASSALDYKTDSDLRSAIKNHSNATTILIAQRISTVINSDCILVIEDGKMVGLGSHIELAQTCDLYKELIQLQLGEQ
jgi:ATP-binding cassette, subfamily B, multidrug efflux pump